jgi:hypothetical protein
MVTPVGNPLGARGLLQGFVPLKPKAQTSWLVFFPAGLHEPSPDVIPQSPDLANPRPGGRGVHRSEVAFKVFMQNS